MSAYVHFLVLGLSAGAVYVALADGLIAVYRATGILNFAQGAMAAWSAYVYATLRTSGELVLPIGHVSFGAPLALAPALAICVVTALIVGLLSHVLVFRPLRQAPVLAQVVASVGLMIMMQALVLLRFGADALYPAAILPSQSVSFLGTELSLDALLLGATAIVLTAGVWAYFRFTRLGVATRASAQNERALRLMGYSPDRLAAIVWAGSSALGGLVVTLASPAVGLNPVIYTWAVVPALAVALLGRLSSVGIACAGGLALGAFQALVTFLTTKPWWPDWAVSGVQDAVPFLVIVVALYLLGGRMPARGSLGELRLPSVTVPQLKPLPVLATVGGAAVLVLVTSGNYRYGIVTSMILTLLAISYVLLTGFLGQISLAQLAFAGTAGFALSKLTTGWHLPFPLSMLAAASIAALLGVAVGLPALRIRGAQLAVVTLALAVAAESFVFDNPKLTPLSGNQIADPKLLGVNFAVREGTDLTRLWFCFMVLFVVTVAVLLTARLMRGATGRAFLAVRSNERAAASVGIDVARTKLLGFALSAFIAGIAGALIGYSRGQLSADSFTALGGLSLLAIVYLGGIGGVPGAIIAGIIGPLGIVYVFLTQTLDLGVYYQLFAGASLIVTAIFNPVGMAGATRQMVDRLLALRRPRRRSRSAGGDPQAPLSQALHVEQESLHVR